MKYYLPILFIFFFFNCVETSNQYEDIRMDPPIFPDYCNITIPKNIAPLNFYLEDFCEQVETFFYLDGKEQFHCRGKQTITIPPKKWKTLLDQANNRQLPIELKISKLLNKKWYRYNPITLHVAENIDPYIAYRLILPGYERWDQMGIFQRNLTSFEETPILTNNLTDHNCMNCHSFSNYQPDHFTLHMRGKLSGTLLKTEQGIRKLDTQTDSTLSTFTYPAWHPSSKYIAFSTNITAQFFHALKEKQIEVFDMNSDIVLYDVQQNKIIKNEQLSSIAHFETYPTWSPDGKKLYFCRADSLSMPYQYKNAQYMICCINFNPEQEKFENKIDTIYQYQGSCAFPRISPDGRHLLFTKLAYGCFPIWHKEADLCMIDLTTGEEISGQANSPESDSYHSWSSNGKWIIFSSRCWDGLFTRLYFSYINTKGEMQKPFLLPQQEFEINNPSLNSYNIPEFIKNKVDTSPYQLERAARQKATKTQIE